jgi:hypothetical protein
MYTIIDFTTRFSFLSLLKKSKFLKICLIQHFLKNLKKHYFLNIGSGMMMQNEKYKIKRTKYFNSEKHDWKMVIILFIRAFKICEATNRFFCTEFFVDILYMNGTSPQIHLLLRSFLKVKACLSFTFF